jgi:hypothetical protein
MSADREHRPEIRKYPYSGELAATPDAAVNVDIDRIDYAIDPMPEQTKRRLA